MADDVESDEKKVQYEVETAGEGLTGLESREHCKRAKRGERERDGENAEKWGRSYERPSAGEVGGTNKRQVGERRFMRTIKK